MRSALIESQFSSAHFYHQPKWSDEKNKETFGRCFTKYGHGHNYKLKIELQIPNDLKENQISSWLEKQKQILNSIVRPLDHEHLNFVIPGFKTKIPTTENILIYLTEKLKSSDFNSQTINASLFEMEDLWTKINLEK